MRRLTQPFTVARIKQFVANPFVSIILVTLLAYGALLPSLGFYWDDWPWMWFAHKLGTQALLGIDVLHRPGSGLLLWLGGTLFGDSPLGWQVFNLLIRGSTAISLYWMLGKLWPQAKRFNLTVSLLFLVYPGFSQQYVSVNSSRHIFPLTLFFLSIGLMLSAIQTERARNRNLIFALFLALTHMLTTEYYYGLELTRPLFIWFALPAKPAWHTDFRKFLRFATPFILLLAGVFTWRFLVSQQNVNYSVDTLDKLGNQPIALLFDYLQTIIADAIASTWGAWSAIFQIPDIENFGSRSLLLYGILAIVAGILSFAFMHFQDKDRHPAFWQTLLLAGAGLLVSGLPFLVTNLNLKFEFPADRFTLPFMFSSALLLTTLIFRFVPRAWMQFGLVAIFVGLSAGKQVGYATEYRRDWRNTRALLEQLQWRIPGLEKNSALLSIEPPINFSTDDSLTAPINWIYEQPTSPEDEIANYLLYLDLRLESGSVEIKSGETIERQYRFFPFESTIEQSILIYYQPPRCLRILSPIYDQHYPQLPELLEEALPYTSTAAIQVTSNQAFFPFASNAPRESWCYYYQKADLARQNGAWQTAAELGDRAFALNDSPNHATELILYVEAYARTGDWPRAQSLTEQALATNPQTQPMLCAAWQRVQAEADPSLIDPENVEEILAQNACKK